MAAEYCKKIGAGCTFCSGCEAGYFGNTVTNIYPIRGYHTNRLLATVEELKREAEKRSGIGLLYILDRGAEQCLVGVSGSYRADPTMALEEARKLVAMLTMMADAKIVAKAAQ